MANKTYKDAISVHGTNPQYLIEKIIRTRIYESRYWKEDCFALSADLVVDKGADLRYIGGTYGGNIKPTPFLCLTLKLLQLQPEKDIIIEFIRQDSFKYIRALGAFYLRLTSNSLDVYKYLEPLYNDYRKLRRMGKMGTFDLIYMDEFVDILLREDRVFDVILPRLTKRFVHVENGELPKRVSLIDEDLEFDEENVDKDSASENEKEKSKGEINVERYRRRSRSTSVDRHRSRRNDEERRRSRRDSNSPSHSRSHHRRSRSTERHREHRRRSHSPSDRRRRERKHRDKEEKRKTKSDKSENNNSDEKPKNEDDEIAEMNALRAKLGLKPLKI
ncbi:Pre-mRNA-splicing factor 38A [Blomia tropicalis]|nr:Pre-mRNA-splicing factor 38A [Blomia tropicalis]